MGPKDKDADGVNFSRRNFLKSTGVVGLAATVVGAPDAAEAQTGPRGGRPGRSAGSADGQRQAARSHDRAARHAARRAPHARRPHRQQARLRPRRVRRLHDDRRRPHRLLPARRSRSKCRASRFAPSTASRNGATLHPVQQAFCDNDALMCGFCTPGFVMATVALLEKHPNPTPEQISKGLDGNICRCGTFVRIMEAAIEREGGGAWLSRRSTAGTARRRPPQPPADPKYAWPEKPALIGTRVKRLDGPDKVAGPRRIHLRHQPPGHALRQDRALAVSARARSSRSICPRRRRRRA